MKTLEWIAVFYLLIAIITGIRLLVIARRITKKAGVDVGAAKFAKNFFLDILCWPYYLIWFGLKAFLDDLR
jgi:hypothetical protein